MRNIGNTYKPCICGHLKTSHSISCFKDKPKGYNGCKMMDCKCIKYKPK